MDPSHKAWHSMSVEEVRRLLATDIADGLASSELARRTELYGQNVLVREKQVTLLGKVLAQFKSSLVFILLAAGIVNVFIALYVDHEAYVDAIVIFLALTINVVIGVLQEERASKAFEKLNASQERRAVVMRDGKRTNIATEDLVPGDLVLLEGGYFVPADLRVVEKKDLKVNEAALTGEWLPVMKSTETLKGDVPLAEQKNMAWMGTLVESGYAKGVVVATGSKTQVGDIALALGSIEEQVTPLQASIRRLARFLSYVVATALVLIFILGIVRENVEFGDLILTAIAVAVATIPSGLPAAVTVVLAIGMEAILKRGGLVRNLLAAETLGATTVILTDKTGTLTEAHMKLASLHSYSGIRDGFVDSRDDNTFLLELAVLQSDAFIEEGTDSPAKITVHGRPIEKAIVVAGLEAGVAQDQLRQEHERIDYLQFSSERRFGGSLYKNAGKKTNRLIIAGEPEKLLAAATSIRIDGKRAKATEHEKKRLTELLAELTSQGKRLIGVAYHDKAIDAIPENAGADLLKGITFAGFLTFEDPIREDVKEAIAEVHGAGAQVIMITGDNPATAGYIARHVGIAQPGDELVIRGAEIEDLSDAELYTKLQSVKVIARAIPAHKLRIARVLKSNGEVVAMTGDGINDAPALRAASIGVAVGSGTEVAKEASDLVLINNSFSIIVAAIEEGRRIIDNLKKIVAYLLSTSFSEIFVIGGALILNLPLPLVPAQILWANIVEEGLMSFSFAFEKRDPHAMKRNPRSAAARNILTRELKHLIFVVSVVTGVLLILLYVYLMKYTQLPLDEVRTIMFVALSLDAIFFSFSLKSLDTPIWRINLFSNTYLLVALGTSVALLVLALTWSPLQHLLSLTPLSLFDSVLLLGVGLANLLTIELVKYLYFERTFKKQAVEAK